MRAQVENEAASAFPEAPATTIRPRVSLGTLLLFVPIVAYLFSLWVFVPLPFPYLTPLLLLLAPLAIQVSRGHVFESISRLWIEFSLLGVIILLSFLSIANADVPFRVFRIVFPSAIAFVLFGHLMVMSFVSRRAILWVPRLLLLGGFLLSVLPFLASHALPPLRPLLFDDYRLKCFFEIAIQHSIALSTLIPLLVGEITLEKRRVRRWLLSGLLLLLAYTTFRAGSKTAMSMGFLGGGALFLVLKFRQQSPLKNAVMIAMVLLVGGFLWFFGLDLAEKLEPEIAGKLRNIVEEGVSSYQSVQIRRSLWQEAWEEGKRHWLIGSGAGEAVLDYPHAHNLILDYFKGIGMFGALSVIGLCLMVFGRTARRAARVLTRDTGDTDKRVLACFVAASVYVLCNQMSDCFGPSTIGFLWAPYLAGVLADEARSRRPVAT